MLHHYKYYIFNTSLLEVLADHMNAEIVAGTISSKQDAMDYVTWTYFFRRLLMNPSYYHLDETSSTAVNNFLSKVVTDALTELQNSYCIELEEVIILTYLCMMCYKVHCIDHDKVLLCFT